MQFDFEDLLGNVFGRIFLVFLFLVSSARVGSAIGAIPWIFSFRDLVELWTSPLKLLNLWIVPNVAFLAAAVVYLMVSENLGYASWGVLVGMESLFVMLGETFRFGTVEHVMWKWLAWLVLLAFFESGIWFVRTMRMNRWARQMAELSIENAMLRAQREAETDGDLN